MSNRRRLRFRTTAWGFVGTLLIWEVFIAIALLHHGTHWPQASAAIPPQAGFPGRPAISLFEAYENWGTLAVLVEFLMVIDWQMARRTRRGDWLGYSLIAVFSALAAIFFWSMTAVLFDWQTTALIRRALLRYPLIAVLLVAIVALSVQADAPAEDTDGMTNNRPLMVAALIATLGLIGLVWWVAV